MSLIFSNLVVIKTLSSNHRMYNLYAKFVKILEICKQFSENLVNDSGNVPRRGPVPKFSDLEVVALSLTAETESIDSEKWLFDYKLQEYKDSIPNLISRRQFNDRRKKTSGLCEELRKRIAMEMDGGEEQFFVDSKPIEVCRVARGKRCKMGRAGNFSQAPDFGFCASQNTYYFGYKLHALCGLSGVIHSYDLSRPSIFAVPHSYLFSIHGLTKVDPLIYVVQMLMVTTIFVCIISAWQDTFMSPKTALPYISRSL